MSQRNTHQFRAQSLKHRDIDLRQHQRQKRHPQKEQEYQDNLKAEKEKLKKKD
jgi:hypothetical protein